MSELGRRVVALSPHLDDAVLSVGAALAAARAGGSDVTVLTVFAGDPAADIPPAAWDRRAGFGSAAAAVRARRAEDAAACRIVGARPVWLPFADEQYGPPPDDDAVWALIEPELDGAETILTPGFPLTHHDHRRVTTLALERLAADERLALYVEQPYAMFVRRDTSGPEAVAADPAAGVAASWRRLRPGARAWVAKQRAARAYGSQLRAIARPLQRVPLLIALHELQVGGEGVGRVVWNGRRRA